MRFLIDHPLVRWFLVGIGVMTLFFGALQYQGNRMQERLYEIESEWLELDQQWNADIADSHAEILKLLRGRCTASD